MLVTNISSFFLYTGCLEGLLSQCHKNMGLFGKDLNILFTWSENITSFGYTQIFQLMIAISNNSQRRKNKVRLKRKKNAVMLCRSLKIPKSISLKIVWLISDILGRKQAK